MGGADPVLSGAGEPILKHHPSAPVGLTPAQAGGQRLVGSSAGAARARKDNTRAQRSAQAGQKPAVERKGKSRPDRTLDNKGSGRETEA